MRGFQYVGRLDEDSPLSAVAVKLCNPPRAEAGDVIAFSFAKDGPLRDGFARVDDVAGNWLALSTRASAACPTIAQHDYVFRATALGEDAFRRLS